MHPVRTIALLGALLLVPTAASGAPRDGAGPRPSLQVRAALRTLLEPRMSAEHLLRNLPSAAAPPGAYARVTRWVEDVAQPRRDGTPRLVVVTVPGGLGLAWARRW